VIAWFSPIDGIDKVIQITAAIAVLIVLLWPFWQDEGEE
jgi:hypothetical protein